MSNDVIAVLEFNSIAVGIRAMDAIVKKAPVKVLEAKTICPGKFLILFTGDVASTEAAFNWGKETGLKSLIDELLITNLHEQVIPALEGKAECKVWDALGIIESFSATAGIEAADIAAKRADIQLLEIKIGSGMGGKSYVKLMGAVESVEAAMQAGVQQIKEKGLLCSEVIIPQPHPDIKEFIIHGNK